MIGKRIVFYLENNLNQSYFKTLPIENHEIWHKDDIEYLFETILPDSKAAIINEEFEFDKIAEEVENIVKKYNYVKKNDDDSYKLA